MQRSVKFDDVITSPPYIDSIDYVYNQMLEYFWLLDELGIQSYDDYRVMRKRPMGFRTYENLNSEGSFEKQFCQVGKQFERICNSIDKQSPKEGLAVRSFFFDYAQHVDQVRAKQRRNGVYACIVGNSLIRGVTVPTADLIVSIHVNAGYELEHKWSYEIRRHYMKFPRRSNSGKIKQDHILVFKLRV